MKATKQTPLTVRGCPAELHDALKKSAKSNRRSLNGEALVWLEREMESSRVVTCAELADALERAAKVLTRKEHMHVAGHIEEARKKMANEHLH